MTRMDNNTAAASEASQPAPFLAVITPDPANQNPPIDVCAMPPVIDTWYGSAVNELNPAAPPPTPGSLSFSWNGNSNSGPFPPPVSGGWGAPYISFDSSTFLLGGIYFLRLAIVNGGDPNYVRDQDFRVSNEVVITTICIV